VATLEKRVKRLEDHLKKQVDTIQNKVFYCYEPPTVIVASSKAEAATFMKESLVSWGMTTIKVPSLIEVDTSVKQVDPLLEIINEQT